MRIILTSIIIAFLALLTLVLSQGLDTTEAKEKQSLFPTVDNLNHLILDDELSNSSIRYEYCHFGLDFGQVSVDTLRIKRNQTFTDILLPLGVSNDSIISLTKISKPVFNTRKINTGKKMLVIKEKNTDSSLSAIVYLSNPFEYITFKIKDNMRVWKGKVPKTTKRKVVVGTISHSLSVALGNPNLTNAIVDVFAWQIDFQHLYKGDQFKIIYDEFSANNKVIDIGDIHSIWFKHGDKEMYAFAYEQKAKLGYYDKNGNSLRKSFLKYPIKFTRISSRYSGARFHPVQKRWKAHRGTDFAAPIGTPIRAVGDGVITKSTYGKYNGNFVKIKHNTNYSTQYLHMSRRAKGIRPGVQVKQGQVIGYVGKSGLARGAHLCFRFWKNNRQVDALRVNLPSEESVLPKKMDEFKKFSEKYREILDNMPIFTETVEKEFTIQNNFDTKDNC